ncbi:polyprotein, partial [Phytophthora megakarya]
MCGMEDSRPLMDSTKTLPVDGNKPFYDTTCMRETIGSLLWISICTRPDITMAVNYLARFVAVPTTAHWTAVQRVLRYSRGSRELKLHFPRSQAPGGLLTINAMSLAWYSKKQSTVALSTVEAEYIAGETAVQDCMWVKQLLAEMELHGKYNIIDLFIDNQCAIKNMKNGVTTARMKHINIKFHFIRNAIRDSIVHVTDCPTTDMKGHIFTKPYGMTLHGRNLSMLKLVILPTIKP